VAEPGEAYIAVQYILLGGTVAGINEKAFYPVTETWKTKYGSRRVKQALPTIDEAMIAAQCLCDEFEQQIELAASLLGIDSDEVRAVAKRLAPHKPERRLSLLGSPRPSAAPRSVVVEYRASKRLVGAGGLKLD
jgi:hypothetical protein